MTDTLLRQWEMLRCIPRFPGKIATTELQSKLAMGGYQITLRSVQRDLAKLSRVLPLFGDDGKPQGWSWGRDASQMDLPALGPQAALTFKLVEVHLQRLLPQATLDYLEPWFRMATGVLEEHNHGLATWPDKIRILSRGMPRHPPVIDPVVQAAVYQALLLERRLVVTYRAPWFDGTKAYVVNPLAIVVRDGQIYLVCTMWHYKDVRHLLLHRILAAEHMEEPACRLEGFDLDSHIAQGEFSYTIEPKSMKFEAVFTAYAAASIAESPLSEDQTLEKLDDVWIMVRATVPDTLDLRAWLMGLGDQVTVRGPQSLVDEIAEIVSTLAQRYVRRSAVTSTG